MEASRATINNGKEEEHQPVVESGSDYEYKRRKKIRENKIKRERGLVVLCLMIKLLNFVGFRINFVW